MTIFAKAKCVSSQQGRPKLHSGGRQNRPEMPLGSVHAGWGRGNSVRSLTALKSAFTGRGGLCLGLDVEQAADVGIAPELLADSPERPLIQSQRFGIGPGVGFGLQFGLLSGGQ
jgi:hypothetical protein